MPDPESENLPVIRRRDGTIRTDVTADELRPGHRDPIRVVGRPIPRQRHRDPIDLEAPATPSIAGQATRIANNTRAWAHQFQAVLPRYLLASGILAIAVWALTGTLWLTLTAAGLPLIVFVWWLNKIRKQAKAYRRGYGPPPPGWFGKL